MDLTFSQSCSSNYRKYQHDYSLLLIVNTIQIVDQLQCYFANKHSQFMTFKIRWFFTTNIVKHASSTGFIFSIKPEHSSHSLSTFYTLLLPNISYQVKNQFDLIVQTLENIIQIKLNIVFFPFMYKVAVRDKSHNQDFSITGIRARNKNRNLSLLPLFFHFCSLNFTSRNLNYSKR